MGREVASAQNDMEHVRVGLIDLLPVPGLLCMCAAVESLQIGSVHVIIGVHRRRISWHVQES